MEGGGGALRTARVESLHRPETPGGLPIAGFGTTSDTMAFRIWTSRAVVRELSASRCLDRN